MPRSVLALHAGSATSVRRRGEPNAYNLVTAQGVSLTVEVRAFEGGAFGPAGRERWRRTDEGWRHEPSW